MPRPNPLTAPITQGSQIVDVGAYGGADRRRVSGPGFRAFLNIMDQWRLSEEERLRILGRPSRSTYHLWASKAREGAGLALPLDTLVRISAVLGIYKALQILFGNEGGDVGWLKGPNNGITFGGQSPLALLASGTQDGIMLVRRYLDAWRGGLFAAPVPGFDSEAPAITDSDIVFL
ncbi:antitoxin Xre/MbcA/ParS toxin-binding domain-containing protein [Telmatospirillum sp.]|uniref:antitoxin Xre/MbcA/ParS toxin-binding domain-containing protein n=1 Tax=Telmatospirillum sp. TaxID=2079197 RepID=UPI0028437CF4|nr:antitoxin Xre/MbcA/ParS toxin-binding domain-containing protein [Telmatospirillum sp.]MDR3439426.1 DUF2384 domain-containing protein [Telmatospirillum sp.]